MKPVIRLVCADCLRSAELERPDGASAVVPDRCAHCGGAIETLWEEPSDEYATPISLALTPDESPLWYDPDAYGKDASTARNPDNIGRFQIREILGGGGFGQVYRAYDPRLDREVALKVLRELHPTARVMERFFREARAAARLDHPNIVALHDAGRDEGRCWIAYRYVEGRSLSQLCREGGPMASETCARVVRTLADALEHAHRHGVVHRDVKPANVIVEPTGRPCLTDFGLARRLDYDATMTVEGTVLGTPAYMSPEQAAGNSHVADARSDIYSLGVILYELLSGHRPADMPSDIPAWRAEAHGPLPPLRGQGRRVPGALDRICQRALASNPADRYPDAQSLAEALGAWLDRRRDRGRRMLAYGVLIGLVCGASSMRVWYRPGPAVEATPAPTSTGAVPDTPKAMLRITIPPRGVASEHVFGITGSRLYHRSGCLSLNRADPDHRREYPSADEAREAGLVTCKLCRSAGGDPPDAD